MSAWHHLSTARPRLGPGPGPGRCCCCCCLLENRPRQVQASAGNTGSLSVRQTWLEKILINFGKKANQTKLDLNTAKRVNLYFGWMKVQLRFNRTLSKVHIDIQPGHLARNRCYKILWIKHSNMSDKSWEKLSTNPPLHWHWNYVAAKKGSKTAKLVLQGRQSLAASYRGG